MAVSYVPKENQNVLLITTAHDSDDILNNTRKKKPVVIDFYNSQRCDVDVVNEMLKDYTSQPVSNSWTIVVLTFILDLSAVNGSPIFKYNCQTKFTNRRAYLKNLASQLCTPHLVGRLVAKNPKHPLSYSDRNCIDMLIQPPIDPQLFARNIAEPEDVSVGRSKKCYRCIIDLEGLGGQ